jgi:O-antigen ligase
VTDLLRTATFWLLVVFVGSIPSENGVTLAGIGSLTRFIGILALGLGVLSLVRRNTLNLRSPALFLAAAALFVLWQTLSYYWSLVPSVTVSRTVTYAQLLIMVWLIWEFARSERQRLILMQGFVVGVYVIIGIALQTLLSPGGAEFRNVGTAFNPNGFAVVTALAIPMAWRLTFSWRRGWLYWLNLLFLPAAALGIILAASRGGLITSLVALLVIPLTFAKLTPLRRLGLTLLIGFMVVGATIYVPVLFPDLQVNIERLSATSEEVQEGDLTGRRDIWAAGLQVFADHPYVGVGSGAFRQAIEPIYGRALGAHNAFVSVLVELGIVGILLWLAMLGLLVYGILKVETPYRLFNLVLFATLIVAMLPTNSENDKFAWFVMSLIAAECPVLFRLAQPADAPLRPSGHRSIG